MRVLITGATGFTGGHLARTLAAGGDTVSALNSYYTYVKLAKLLELQQGAPPPP